MNQRKHSILTKALAAQILATSIFSFHYVAAKRLLQNIDSYAFISLRGLLSGLLMFLVYLFIQHRKDLPIFPKNLQRKDYILAFLMMLLGYGFNQVLFINGLMQTTASNTALLANSLPLLVYGFAVISGQEHFSKQKTIALCSGFLAIFVFFWHQKEVNLLDQLYGNLLVFGAFASLSISLLISKKQMNLWNPTFNSALILFGGGTIVYIIKQPELKTALSISLSTTEFQLLFLFEIVITSLAWFLNFYAIEKIGASNASAINFFQIPITALLAYLYFETIPSISLWILTCVLLPASWVIIIKSKHRRSDNRCVSKSEP